MIQYLKFKDKYTIKYQSLFFFSFSVVFAMHILKKNAQMNWKLIT